MKFAYKWLKRFFDELPSPDELQKELSVRSFELEGVEGQGENTVFDFDILPNRAPDCYGHLGFAREIRSVFDIPLTKEYFEVKNIEEADNPVAIGEIDKDAVRAYRFFTISNVNLDDSSSHIKELLSLVGQKPINNLVDITNFIMFEFGQPVHVYDKNKIVGKISIRFAKPGEKIELLGGEILELAENNLIIADEAGPLSLAGIKGGERASVDENTSEVVFEIVSFNPTTIRHSRKASKIFTDASKRFENNIPVTVTEKEKIIARIVNLLSETCPSVTLPEISSEIISGDRIPEVVVSKNIFERIAGEPLDVSKLKVLAERIGARIDGDGENIKMAPPYYRKDLNCTEDLVEEYIRINGFENFKNAENPTLPTPEINRRAVVENALSSHMSRAGYFQIMTYSFTDKGHGSIEVKNKIASDKGYMRKSLAMASDMIEPNKNNADLIGIADAVRLFEIGVVFEEDNPDKQNLHAIFINHPLSKKKAKLGTIDEIKSEVNNALKSVGVELIDGDICDEGACHLEIRLDDIMERILEDIDYRFNYDTYGDKEFRKFSQYPFISRDISVWLEGSASEDDLVEVVRDFAGEYADLVKNMYIFDKFEKDGKASVAVRIVFQSDKETLSDKFISEIFSKLENTIDNDPRFTLR